MRSFTTFQLRAFLFLTAQVGSNFVIICTNSWDCYNDTQQTLADKLGISVWSIRAWEQGKSYPFSNVLLAICKLYGTSADYLLGLTDIDPSDEARKQRQRLTEEEQNEMHRYEEYLLWKRKK